MLSSTYRPGAARPARRGPRATLLFSILALGLADTPAAAQQTPIEMTLERMVELSLSDSYRIRNLNYNIDRRRLQLRAEEARLRSSVDLELSAPELESIAEPRWNSTLGLNEIVHETSRRWEAELSIRQPVILFGYPTNGYLSLNNRIYRYLQIEEDGNDLRYYNRYFVRYTQPLFQPNELRNDLEEARLDLEDTELDFQDDVVGTVEDLSRDYLELFEDAYNQRINERLVANLEAAAAAAEAIAAADANRTIELNQAQVELANAREGLQQARSQFRLQAASLKTRLNLAASDSITLDPVIDVVPVGIDVGDATEYALQLTPRFRQLAIDRRRDEIDIDQTEGRNSFRVDLEFSYGRERLDDRFSQIFGQPSNTYTVDVNAYLPIWDWGERSARIQASEIGLRQTELRIEQVTSQVVSDVQNEVRNIEEYQSRALSMEQNLELATDLSESSLGLYTDGSATILDVLQSFRREADTAENLLDAYVGWRRAILRIQRLTFYDFERDVPVLDRYGIVPVGQGT